MIVATPPERSCGEHRGAALMRYAQSHDSAVLASNKRPVPVGKLFGAEITAPPHRPAASRFAHRDLPWEQRVNPQVAWAALARPLADSGEASARCETSTHRTIPIEEKRQMDQALDAVNRIYRRAFGTAYRVRTAHEYVLPLARFVVESRTCLTTETMVSVVCGQIAAASSASDQCGWLRFAGDVGTALLEEVETASDGTMSLGQIVIAARTLYHERIVRACVEWAREVAAYEAATPSDTAVVAASHEEGYDRLMAQGGYSLPESVAPGPAPRTRRARKAKARRISVKPRN